jgi:hypothetical protein
MSHGCWSYGRAGQHRIDRLLERYGPEIAMPDLRHELAQCPLTARRHPTLDDQWMLELPTGATLTAPMGFDDDGDPVFSLPRGELLAHVALRDCDPTDMDFRPLPDGGFEIDLGSVVVDRH